MFKAGDKVIVAMPSHEAGIVSGMRRFKGRTMTVEKVIKYAKYSGHAYILADCKSGYGIDYEWCEDWLLPYVEPKGAGHDTV